jgi:hypothetical protein
MKSFEQFLTESITINGDFNGTLNVGGSTQPEPATESYVADVVWEGKIYRFEIEGSMPSKNKLAEQLQNQYPGAVVHNIYPSESNNLKIKSSQRYRPERLSWSD